MAALSGFYNLSAGPAHARRPTAHIRIYRALFPHAHCSPHSRLYAAARQGPYIDMSAVRGPRVQNLAPALIDLLRERPRPWSARQLRRSAMLRTSLIDAPMKTATSDGSQLAVAKDIEWRAMLNSVLHEYY